MLNSAASRVTVALFLCPFLFQGSPTQKFEGRWKGNNELNLPAILGGMIGPDFLMPVSRSGDTLVVSREYGGTPAPIAYKLDGSEADAMWLGKRAKTRLSWSGDALVLEIRSVANSQQSEKTVMTIDDGRLRANVTASTADGKVFDFKIYFDRDRQLG